LAAILDRSFEVFGKAWATAHAFSSLWRQFRARKRPQNNEKGR
jgi:hypothetical protein